jgi:hypothetical protein
VERHLKKSITAAKMHTTTMSATRPADIAAMTIRLALPSVSIRPGSRRGLALVDQALCALPQDIS